MQKLNQTPDRGRLNLPLKEALLKQPEPRSELTIFSHNSILFIWNFAHLANDSYYYSGRVTSQFNDLPFSPQPMLPLLSMNSCVPSFEEFDELNHFKTGDADKLTLPSRYGG